MSSKTENPPEQAVILAVASEKGGAGKSTVITNLATLYARRGDRVVILDLDPQQSVASWGRIRGAREDVNPVEVLPSCSLGEIALEALVASYDRILVDTPGSDSSSTRETLMICDTVIVPSLVGGFSFVSAGHTFKVIEQAKEIRSQTDHPLGAALLLNASRKNGVGARELRKHWKAGPIHLLDTEWYALDDFWIAAQEGLGVVELAPTGLAARQAKSLLKEID